MGAKIVHFFKYNNAFTLAILFLFFSTGTIFAANEDMRATLISSEEQLVAVDNEHIINVNLSRYEPEVKVLEVTEDDESYYVAYRINTIEIVDGVWSDVSKEAELVVAKKLLGDRDLGLYVAEELREVASAELARLREVQTIEKNIGRQNRTVEKKYKGLIGRMLDSKTASFKGYKPVIPPEKKPVPIDREAQLAQLIEQKLARQAAFAEEQETTQEEPEDVEPQSDVDEPEEPEESDEPDETPTNDVDTGSSTPDTVASTTPTQATSTPNQATSTPKSTSTTPVTEPPTSTTTTNVADTTPPVITLKGAASISLMVGDVYAEPGATAVDEVSGDVTVTITGTVDVNTAGTYSRTYTAVDDAGNESSKTRTITVAEPPPPPPSTPTSTES